MLNISKLFIIFSSYFIANNYSFELGLWRGSTHYYTRNYNNKFDFTKPIITTYNYSYNSTENFDKTCYYSSKNNLKIKLQSYKKNGGIVINVSKYTNGTHFNNQINFYNNDIRSIINVNYYYGKDNVLKLNYISVSGLRCGLVKSYKNKNKITNISSLINKLKLWTYCKTTNINSKNIYDAVISESDKFEFEYLMNKIGHISNIFIDNLVVSVPDFIDDNKPFSMLFGCLISDDCYKQITLNYNFNGYLVFTEFNEYEPFNLNKKINNLLDFALFNLRLRSKT